MSQQLSLPAPTMDALVQNVVGFRFIVERFEAVSKLSQNRSDTDYAKVIRMLEKSDDRGAPSVALAMRRRRPS